MFVATQTVIPTIDNPVINTSIEKTEKIWEYAIECSEERKKAILEIGSNKEHTEEVVQFLEGFLPGDEEPKEESSELKKTKQNPKP